MEPLGYFLTFTTYGTRPSGDGRGWVHRARNKPGTPVEAPDAYLERRMLGRMKFPPLLLDDEMRIVVADTIEAHAAFRSWRLHAMNVRTNHVHLVVAAHGYTPEKVIGECKSWSSRRLRERGLIPPGRTVWTEGGSTIWLNTEGAFHRAVTYTSDEQGADLGTTNR